MIKHLLAHLFGRLGLQAGHTQIHALAVTATQNTLRAIDIVRVAFSRLIPATGELSHQLVLDRRCIITAQVIVLHAEFDNSRSVACASRHYG